MKAIVSIDNLWGIGKNGKLLFRIGEDMKFFKKITSGKVVVMGRKTLQSLPNSEPLSDRTNLVITSKSNERYDNVVFGDLDAINKEIKKYDTNDVFIIGGTSIYEQFIHRCDTIYVTRNDTSYISDSHMPNLAFEGFTLNRVINKGITNLNNNWYLEEWITSESSPYVSVLWYKDAKDKITFLYYNLKTNTWKDLYSNTQFYPSSEFKKYLFKKILRNIDVVETRLHNYYRAEVLVFNDKEILRLASFGLTQSRAKDSIMNTIINLLS